MKDLPENPELSFKMYELISRYWTACAIHTCAKLRIADLLSDGPKTLSELAKESDTHERSLYRLLRAVTSEGIFEEQPNKIFILNDLGSTLLSGVPGSIRPWALANLGELFPAFGNLTHSIKTGEIAFNDVYGMPIWEYYKGKPEEGKIFMEAMAGVSGAVMKGIIDVYDFTPYKTIVDIGGGNGALMFTMLRSSPSSHGIIFDEQYVVEATEKKIPEDLKDRCIVEGGSFFKKIPSGADLYVTKWVVHDWNDEEALQLYKICYEAMKIGSKLLIIDAVVPDELNTPHAGKILDIDVMVLTPGIERTLNETKELLTKAGLTFRRLIPTSTEISSIIECEKLAL